MSCKVGNQTNSQDPQAVNSRVFVGNLNTFQCSKTDVERIFQRYGRIAGISMHKGYAFIQFTNPFDARSACLGEDGRLLWGQTLDVNMVAEPKAHQTGRKRQNIAKTGNDWDYYYDSLKLQLESIYRSYYAQVGFPGPRLVPPMKRQRLHVPPNSQNKSLPKLLPPANKPNPVCNSLGDLKSYNLKERTQLPKAETYGASADAKQNQMTHFFISVHTSAVTDRIKFDERWKWLMVVGKEGLLLQVDTKSILSLPGTPDILICGNCRELFSDVEQLVLHKKTYCKLRFTCKCHQNAGKTTGEEPAALLCVQPHCKDSFQSAWDLMVHLQAAHQLTIYQLGMDRDQSEGKDGENGGCFTNGSGSPNGFNPTNLMGDNLMEDSHCQTDLDLPHNHRLENSCMIMENFTGGCSLATNTSRMSTSTSTNDCGHSGTHESSNVTRNCQGRMISVNGNGDICNGLNQPNHLMNGMAGTIITANSSPTCPLVGQVNNNNSPTPLSQTIPIEASTQTSLADNLLLSTVNGPSCGSSGPFDELCLVSTIKGEAALLPPLTNGQVAGI